MILSALPLTAFGAETIASGTCGADVLNSDEAAFGKIVADTEGYAFKNDAVNGYTTSDLLGHLEKPEIAADVENADIISVSTGGNNFLRGNMKQLIADDAPLSPETYI